MMTNMQEVLDRMLDRIGRSARQALVTSAQLAGSDLSKSDPEERKKIAAGLRETMLDGMRTGQAVSLILEHLRDTELTPEQQFLASDILEKIRYCLDDDDMKKEGRL